MSCPQCGFETDSNFNFCPNCGAILEAAKDEAFVSAPLEGSSTVPAGDSTPLEEAALQKVSAVSGESDEGEVFSEKSDVSSEESDASSEESDASSEESEASSEDTKLPSDGHGALEGHEAEAVAPGASAESFAAQEKSLSRPEARLRAKAEKPVNRLFVGIMAIIAIVMFGLSAMLFSGILDGSAMPAFNAEAQYSLSDGGKADGAGGVKPENIYIPEKEITLFEGQSKWVVFEIYPQNADLSEISWEASGSGVSISSNGRLTAVEPGWSGRIKVTCGEAYAEADVHVFTKDEAFFETINWIAHKKQNQTISFKERKITPAPLKSRLMAIQESEARRKWGANLFARVNDELAAYSVYEERLTNEETGNIVDCHIYKATDTGDIRKLVTIERFADYLIATDYYFTNGKLGFIFERKDVSYRPGVANWSIEGTRLYFEDDAMTTWRDVRHADERLQREAALVRTDASYGMNGIELSRTEYIYDYLTNTVKNIKAAQMELNDEELSALSAEYAAIEEKALSAAYSLYDKLEEMPETLTLSGGLVTLDALPVKGVPVKVFSEQHGMLVGQTVTDADGAYKITVPRDELPYTVSISQSGYYTANIYNVETAKGASNGPLPPVSLVPEAAGEAVLLLSVLDAETSEPSDLWKTGGLLRLREGVNNTNGEVAASIVLPAYVPETDEEDGTAEEMPENAAEELARPEIILGGQAGHEAQERPEAVNIPNIAWLPSENAYAVPIMPGIYTAEIAADGYEASFVTVSAGVGETRVRAVATESLRAGSMRIVLTWSGAPMDLDAHLFAASGGEASARFLSTENLRLAPGDDADGYGPETITISRVGEDVYRYFVADISNCLIDNLSSRQMSGSFAEISVYGDEGLMKKFYVPRNLNGVVWHVFNISEGNILPVERYYNNVSDFEWWEK